MSYKTLALVQQEVKAPKDQRNEFGKYNYRSAENILEAVKPILAKHNSTILLEDDVVQVGERYYFQATATFIDLEDEREIKVSALAREDENQKGITSSQLSGSTSSYARKYALNGLLLLDDNKDADSWNKVDTKTEEKIASIPTKISDATSSLIEQTILNKRMDRDKCIVALNKRFGKAEIFELTEKEGIELLSLLGGKANANQ